MKAPGVVEGEGATLETEGFSEGLLPPVHPQDAGGQIFPILDRVWGSTVRNQRAKGACLHTPRFQSSPLPLQMRCYPRTTRSLWVPLAQKTETKKQKQNNTTTKTHQEQERGLETTVPPPASLPDFTSPGPHEALPGQTYKYTKNWHLFQKVPSSPSPCSYEQAQSPWPHPKDNI